ncbi:MULTISPECIES: helix-turn-helix domain-containing protein [Halorussus]|uniref:helix-turn-helix domain-containing protein n=1 Tax=Halorussus TaxID=1070314 RepID=UPI000E213F84|nr:MULTISPECIES: helix-turn-helix domain-containing protein [Halorussus]NHN58661.1 bacterio-opsin activator [Halorussus sp. JP-T4]
MTDGRVIAEIRLTHPELVLTRTIRAVPEMTTELEYQTIAGPESYYLFFKVSGGDFDAFDAAVAEDPTVGESVVTVEGDDFRIYRMLLASADHLVLPEAANLGMRILRARDSDPDGGWLATLEVPELAALQRFRDHCADRGVDFAVVRLYRADDDDGSEFGLTPVQRDTLVAAYEHGYFENPRDASVGDLGDLLGVSPSAVSGRLRRGIRNLVESTLLR